MRERMAHHCLKHMPGSAACYTRHGCRCVPCRTVANRVKKLYRALPSPLVDAAPVQAHIEALIDSGRTLAWVAGRLGRSVSYLQYVMTEARRMHLEIAGAILAISPDMDGGMVDATGTKRRIGALAAMGWPTSWIDRELGHTHGYTHHILAVELVNHRTAKKYAALYDRLWDAPPSGGCVGSITRVRRWAASSGFPPPLAWDDGNGPHGIDNPAATPIGVGWQKPRNAAENVIELAEQGEVLAAIETRLGLSKSGIQKALETADRLDLWPKIMREMVA